MAIRKIVQDSDPFLRKKSMEVKEFNTRLHVLLDDMRDTLHKENGAGLAAPQVGVLKRAVIVEVDKKFYELINPKIVHTEGVQRGYEACLSVKGKSCIVDRPQTVTVEAYDRYGKIFRATGHGLTARAFCHEVDHLDGILYYDRKVAEKSEE